MTAMFSQCLLHPVRVPWPPNQTLNLIMLFKLSEAEELFYVDLLPCSPVC